jgi:hypothetical protein
VLPEQFLSGFEDNLPGGYPGRAVLRATVAGEAVIYWLFQFIKLQSMLK